jgi:hypothetical protein
MGAGWESTCFIGIEYGDGETLNGSADHMEPTIRTTLSPTTCDRSMGSWDANCISGIRSCVCLLNMTNQTLDKPGYWGVHATGEFSRSTAFLVEVLVLIVTRRFVLRCCAPAESISGSSCVGKGQALSLLLPAHPPFGASFSQLRVPACILTLSPPPAPCNGYMRIAHSLLRAPARNLSAGGSHKHLRLFKLHSIRLLPSCGKAIFQSPTAQARAATRPQS